MPLNKICSVFIEFKENFENPNIYIESKTILVLLFIDFAMSSSLLLLFELFLYDLKKMAHFCRTNLICAIVFLERIAFQR